MTLLFAPFWLEHRGTPHLMLAGLMLHAYGVMMIIFAGRELVLLGRIDTAAPVLIAQRQFAELRAWHLRANLVFGITSCVIWIPLLVVLFTWVGADVWALDPNGATWLLANIVIALVLLLGFLRWTSKPSRLAKAFEQTLVGRRIRKAQDVLDELARFEQA